MKIKAISFLRDNFLSSPLFYVIRGKGLKGVPDQIKDRGGFSRGNNSGLKGTGVGLGVKVRG